MRELVRLAEVREAQAKQELVHLLQSRSNMFEAQNAAGEGQPDYATYDREIDDARRRMASAKEKFNKLRTVCISAQQVGVAAVPACRAAAGGLLKRVALPVLPLRDALQAPTSCTVTKMCTQGLRLLCLLEGCC